MVGRDSNKFKQLSIEQTWPKTKLRELREPKILWLEGVHSNRAVVKFLIKSSFTHEKH